ncbi:MAG: hypothetical protein PHG48_02800 [Eubacteriales bacterium]|nr:hypothetical protein [Eubacteriales bacterium]
MKKPAIDLRDWQDRVGQGTVLCLMPGATRHDRMRWELTVPDER